MNEPKLKIPTWATNDADYSDPGEDWDGEPRIKDPGSLMVDGYAPDEQPGVQEDNYMRRSVGEHVKYLADIQVLNWHTAEDSGADDLVGGCYFDSIDAWIVVGDEDARISAGTGTWATLGAPTGITYLGGVGADGVVPTANRAIIFDADTIQAVKPNGDLDTKTQISNAPDSFISGLIFGNSTSVHYIMAGLVAGATDALRLYYSNDPPGHELGVDDMLTVTEHAAPTLGTTADAVVGNAISDKSVVFAARQQESTSIPNDRRAICLISWRGSGQSRVDQLISTTGNDWDGPIIGETTTDVFSLEGGDGATNMLAGVAYDPRGRADGNDKWVAVSKDGHFHASPCGAEAWSHLGNVTGMVPITGGFHIFGNLWVVAAADRIWWSRTGGTYWSNAIVTASSVRLIKNAKHGQLMFAQADGLVRRSLAVGGPAPIALTPPS